MLLKAAGSSQAPIPVRECRQVIQVPSHDWEALRTLANKLKYLGNRLDTAMLNGPAREPVNEEDMRPEEIEPSVWKFWW